MDSFNIAFQAWKLNEKERKPRKMRPPFSSRNALKIPDSEIEEMIKRLDTGEKILDVYKDMFLGRCHMTTITSRLKNMGYEWRKNK